MRLSYCMRLWELIKFILKITPLIEARVWNKRIAVRVLEGEAWGKETIWKT